MGLSLNSRVDWVAALKAFGVRPVRHSLPSKTECPLCRDGRLRVTHDSTQGGAWGYCRKCRFSGDMISLAREFWKCNSRVSVGQLQEHGALSASINDRLIAEREKDVILLTTGQNLLKSAVRGGRSVTDTKSITQLGWLGFPKPTNVSWATTGPGALLGYTQRDELEEALRPRKSGSPRKYRPREVRVGHSDADGQFMVPFFDQPDRMVSTNILYAPQKGVWREKDYYLQYVAGGQESGGLAYHPDTLAKAGEGKLLAVDHVETYLRLHMKSFQSSPTALPLVCYRNGDAFTNTWDMFSGRSIVFWCNDITPDVMRQAIRLDGYIVCGLPDANTSKEFVSTRDPNSVVKRKLKAAKHWSVVVASLIEEKDSEDLSDFLAALDLTSDERVKIEDACASKFRPKLSDAVNNCTPVQTVQMSSGYMEQRPTGWYHIADRNGESLITNCPFKIVRAMAVAGKCTYLVEAKLHQHTFTFTADMKQFEKKPFELVHEAAIQQGCGVTTFDSKHQAQGTYIAKQLHTPEVTKPITTVGYDTSQAKLVLPNITISSVDGRIGISPPTDIDQPGSAIEKAVPDRMKLRKMLGSKDSVTVMSVFLAVANQVLCDVVGIDAPKVGLQGKSTRKAALEVAGALGLATVDTVQAQKILIAAGKHRWPLITGIDRVLTKAASKTVLGSDRRVVMPVTREQVVYGLLSQDLITVQSTGYSGLPKSQVQQLGPLLVELVSYMAEYRQQELLGTSKGTLNGTYRLLKAMLDHKKVAYPNLGKAFKLCLYADSHSEALAMGVARMVEWGLVPWGGKTPESNPANSVWRDGDKGVMVPRDLFNRTLQAGGAPSLDLHEVGLLLSESKPGAYTRLQEESYFWLLNDEQFMSALRAQRRMGPNRLKVVSA